MNAEGGGNRLMIALVLLVFGVSCFAQETAAPPEMPSSEAREVILSPETAAPPETPSSEAREVILSQETAAPRAVPTAPGAASGAPAAPIEGPAAAQAPAEKKLPEEPAPPERISPRWAVQGASLLFYDDTGMLSNEIGLGRWEETVDGGTRVTRILGGTSDNGRFAWTIKMTTDWNRPKNRTLGTASFLSFFGTGAIPLWTETRADIPPGSEPLSLSASGEVVAVALREGPAWMVSVRNYLGNVILEKKAIPSLSSVKLTRNGSYLLVRWAEVDKSDTHTFVEIWTGSQKDIPSTEFVLGRASLTEDGKVFSGEKLLHDFESGFSKTDAR